MFTKIVSDIGFTVVATANNGQEAVDVARHQNPHLVLLDINMPLKTGIEALEELVEEFSETVFIMLSSVSETEVVEKCMDLGAHNYIVRNTSKEEIAKTIRETWERNSFI